MSGRAGRRVVPEGRSPTNGCRPHALARRARLTSIPFVVAALAACGPSESGPPPMRMWTQDFALQVSSDPVPPRALERVKYKVVVRDKKTGEPIQNGEGRIFATNRDRKSIDNGLVKGPEVGTYYTTLFFVTSGDWAMGVQFRRDSTQSLQRTQDWMQEVRTATPPATPAPQ